MGGNPECIRALIAAGAGVIVGAKFFITPLHEAAQYDTPSNTQALLAGGADVMARDEGGGTPLHHAAGSLFNDEASANIQALIAAGADAKAKSKYGATPWDLAQLNDRLKGTKAYWALNEAQYN